MFVRAQLGDLALLLIERPQRELEDEAGNVVGHDAPALYELRHSARLGSAVSLLLLDLDRFKAINDTLRPTAGSSVSTPSGAPRSRRSAAVASPERACAQRR